MLDIIGNYLKKNKIGRLDIFSKLEARDLFQIEILAKLLKIRLKLLIAILL